MNPKYKIFQLFLNFLVFSYVNSVDVDTPMFRSKPLDLIKLSNYRELSYLTLN